MKLKKSGLVTIGWQNEDCFKISTLECKKGKKPFRRVELAVSKGVRLKVLIRAY